MFYRGLLFRLPWRRLGREAISQTVLLIFSLAVNLGLAIRTTTLERTIEILKGEQRLKIGAEVPPIEVGTNDGSFLQLRYDHVTMPTLLYVMTPKCVWCQRHNLNMNALATQSGSNYRMLIVSLTKEGVEDYQRKYAVGQDISFLSPQSQLNLRLAGTPTTLLISPTGRILGRWVGAYDDTQRREIEKRLAVTLPGLAGEVASR